MNIRNKPALREKLAAEYALGTLKGGARRRFEGWMHQDADLRNISAKWQERLAPMVEFAGEAAVPKRVWRGIERRLELKTKAGRWQFWLNENINFWRNLGLVSSAVAAMLLVVVLTTVNTAEIAYVATLTDDKTNNAMVVTADRRNRALGVRLITSDRVAADRSLHLWAVPKSGKPRSLGVLKDDHGTFVLADNAISADVALLAVTLEPKGGSPDPNGPTGPIVYKGAWVRL